MKYDTGRILPMRKRMLVQPSICVERAKIITDSFRKTEGEPAAVRRAKALRQTLQEMSVQIFEDELIVGKPTSKIRGGSISPELQCDWILNELDILSTRETDPFQPLTEEEKEVLTDVVSYWKDKSLRVRWNEEVPEESKKYDDLIIGGGAFCGNNQYYGHCSPDYALILQLGTEGICDKIDRQLKQDISKEQKEELEAMKLAMESLPILAERYSRLAKEMAEKESDGKRKAELEKIAEVCMNVPKKPAGNFYEAVQSIWFAYMGVFLENWGTGNTFLRVDQYLYPYYLKDKKEGSLSDQEAFELICMLLVNCNSCCIVYSEQRSHGFAGNCSGCSFTLGGITPEGECAVNELSYLFLEAERTVNMGSDDLVIRINDNTPAEFLYAACHVARDVGGKLKFLGDKTTIANLELDGLSHEDANDYGIAGCTSPMVGGKYYDIPGGIIGVPNILELALNNGVQRMTGIKMGADTGNAAEFTSYEQLWEAFCTQARYVIPHCHNIKNADKKVYAKYSPSPFQSALSESCIESATDIVCGGTKPYLTYAMSLAGMPNVGDSLAAIKKFVFEEKRITMAQVIEAIEADFEGYEDLRVLLLRAPKFGNNNAYVDEIVNDVVCFMSDLVGETTGYLGAMSNVAAAAVTANVGLGMVLGATPDGRHKGEPISDGGISPVCGANDSGMTATMLSVAGLTHSKLRHGEVLNIRMDPKAVETDDKLSKFASLIRAYVNAGGFLVQFNIVSTETLKDAQIHPELHRDLIVRVATYAAYFIELGEELQNDIIRRMEFDTV